MSQWPINFFRCKSTWLVIRAAVLFSCLNVFPGHATASAPNKELKKGESLPWIAGWTVDGQVINLNHLLRKGYGVNVLLVSASWCEACKVCFKKLMPMRARASLILSNSQEPNPLLLSCPHKQVGQIDLQLIPRLTISPVHNHLL